MGEKGTFDVTASARARTEFLIAIRCIGRGKTRASIKWESPTLRSARVGRAQFKRRLKKCDFATNSPTQVQRTIVTVNDERPWQASCDGVRVFFICISFNSRSKVQPLRRTSCRALHSGIATPDSTTAALDLIRSQPSHYVIATFAGRKYLIAPRDLLTVPRLRDVNVGDIVTLDQIHELGSREYTIRGNPVISPERVKVQATVVEHTKGNMEFIFKKKRRKGYQKTVTHKQPYTRLRIGNIDIPVPKLHPLI